MSYTPEGFSTLSAVIISKDARSLLKTYEDALGIEVKCLMDCPLSGKVGHACLDVKGSSLFVSDEFPEEEKVATGGQEFYLYVEHADDTYAKAKANGFTAYKEPEDMFWGDRVATLKDADGNIWKIAQKVRDVSPEEMDAAVKAMADAA